MRFDKAKEQLSTHHPDVTVTVHYHPFMIDPGTQPDGEDYASYNRRRWGGDGWTRSMRAMGQKEGAPYANWVTWPNTTHVGRLLLLAERHGLGDKVITILYRMCYEDGENVSTKETVARAAREAGVPSGDEYVRSDAGLLELSQCLRGSRVNGKRITAAPTFNVTVNGATHDFSGAQDASRWLKMLEACAEMAMG